MAERCGDNTAPQEKKISVLELGKFSSCPKIFAPKNWVLKIFH